MADETTYVHWRMRLSRPTGDIIRERLRQERFKLAGLKYTCADIADDYTRCSAILGEEKGGVDREVCDLITAMEKGNVTAVHEGRKRLRAELIQVAAVALAWVEGLDQSARPSSTTHRQFRIYYEPDHGSLEPYAMIEAEDEQSARDWFRLVYMPGEEIVRVEEVDSVFEANQ